MGSYQSTLQSFTTSFTWTINNISKLISESSDTEKKTVEFFFSASPDGDNLKWKLEFHPFCGKSEIDNGCSIYLYLIESNKLSVEARMRYTILYPSLQETSWTGTTKNHTFKVSEETPRLEVNNFGDYDQIFSKYAKIVSKKDELNIKCELTILNCENCPENIDKNPKTFSDKIINDYKNLLEDESKADVTLSAGGKQFKAHKLILSSRSRVFSTMFKNDFRETTSNYIRIPDMEAETLKQMLLFIYCGNSDKIKDLNIDLLKAAAKYELHDLQEVCASSLMESLEVEIAAQALILAELHKEKALKEKTLAFIKANSAEVVKTEGWTELIKLPNLMHEVCVLLAKP